MQYLFVRIWKEIREALVAAFPILERRAAVVIVFVVGSVCVLAVSKFIGNQVDRMQISAASQSGHTSMPPADSSQSLGHSNAPAPPAFKREIDISSVRLTTSKNYYIGPNYEEIKPYSKTLSTPKSAKKYINIKKLEKLVAANGDTPCYEPSSITRGAAGYLADTENDIYSRSEARLRKNARIIINKSDPIFDIVFQNTGNQTEVFEGINLKLRTIDMMGFGGDSAATIGEPLPIQSTFDILVDGKKDHLTSWAKNPIVMPPGALSRIRVHLAAGGSIIIPNEGDEYITTWIGHFELIFSKGFLANTKDICVAMPVF